MQRADLAPPRRLRGVHVTLRGAGGDVQRAAVMQWPQSALFQRIAQQVHPGLLVHVRLSGAGPAPRLQRHIGLARMQQRHGAAAPQRFVGLAIQAVQPFMRRGRVHRPPGEVRVVARPAGFGARRRQQLLPTARIQFRPLQRRRIQHLFHRLAVLAVPRILPDPPQRGGIRCIVHQVQRGVDEGRVLLPAVQEAQHQLAQRGRILAAAPAPVTSGRCCSSSPGWHRLAGFQRVSSWVRRDARRMN